MCLLYRLRHWGCVCSVFKGLADVFTEMTCVCCVCNSIETVFSVLVNGNIIAAVVGKVAVFWYYVCNVSKIIKTVFSTLTRAIMLSSVYNLGNCNKTQKKEKHWGCVGKGVRITHSSVSCVMRDKSIRDLTSNKNQRLEAFYVNCNYESAFGSILCKL